MMIIDTNIAIYYLQGDKEVVRIVNKWRKQEDIALSVLSEVELFSFTGLSPVDVLTIHEWLQHMTIIPVDSIIARAAARFRREYRLKTPDAIIVATASIFNAGLCTKDKSLQKVKNIRIIS